MNLFIALLIVVVVVFLLNRKRTSYTLEVTIEPKEAANISEIMYRRGPGFIVAEFSLKIKEGYRVEKWTGTLPRLEGYDPSLWYDSKTGRVRLEIAKNEQMTIHLGPAQERGEA
ncbi:MAG: hypothetical protein QM372_10715 [Bacillota bacterium]|nr:hypothetical protein [Bacillota bacterium]NLJ02944.1 hypothetical protein [Bacillota bacterium]